MKNFHTDYTRKRRVEFAKKLERKRVILVKFMIFRPYAL